MQYSSYLKTLHWKRKRAEKLLANPICQVCGQERGVNVHHKRYKDKENRSILFNEKLTDLIVLCSGCHRLVHFYFGINVNKINKKILRVKSLLAKGAIKNKAFWIVSQDASLFVAIAHPKL